jgi:hypothetical protein
LEYDPNFIDKILSVNLVSHSSALDRELLTLRPIVNKTSSFNFTLLDIDGRSKKKLVILLRSNRTDIFNSFFSDSVLKLKYKELKSDQHHRELEIFSDFFKPAQFSFTTNNGHRALLVVSAIFAGSLILAGSCWLGRKLVMRQAQSDARGD